jgi:hypothetical protein
MDMQPGKGSSAPRPVWKPGIGPASLLAAAAGSQEKAWVMKVLEVGGWSAASDYPAPLEAVRLSPPG